MKKSLFFFHWCTQKTLFLGALFLISLFFTFFSGAFANDKETPPTGKLIHGSYTQWLENILETPPNSDSESLGNNNAVKQSNSITTQSGEKVLWIIDNKLGIGISTPQEILDIRSEKKASLRVESSTENTQVSLGNTIISLLEGDFFIQAGNQKLFFTEQGINTSGELTVNNKNVVPSSQECPTGQKISGTDDEGNVICSEFITNVSYCNLNTINLSEKIAVIGKCQLAPNGNENGCILNFSGEKFLDGNCNFDTQETVEKVCGGFGDFTVGECKFSSS